ncbi:DUF4194 domain-containing protein [Thalassomonas viridans]|uniref:DUF4194 domain-containing protein n=2 Tax=Thalassomonas viridans TaxID=137584 RepID=A0AAE9Z8C9_9GAMM|nr:DUF4194 domain-containing protein [Thalassomonas viridans]
MTDPNEIKTNLTAKQQQEKSAVQIKLLKGPVYRAKHKDLWLWLERDLFQIREYFQQIGLSLLLDDAEGYAFLKQQSLDEANEGEQDIPRLITRRSLSFSQTLLMVLLRKRLAEHDSEDSSPRLIVERHDMHQWLTGFYPVVSNEVKQKKEFDALIKKIAEMGFLSQLPNHQDEFEVQRILKAVINAEQISELIDMLASQHNQEEQA